MKEEKKKKNAARNEKRKQAGFFAGAEAGIRARRVNEFTSFLP